MVSLILFSTSQYSLKTRASLFKRESPKKFCNNFFLLQNVITFYIQKMELQKTILIENYRIISFMSTEISCWVYHVQCTFFLYMFSGFSLNSILNLWRQFYIHEDNFLLQEDKFPDNTGFRVMVFNATLNNISAISWQSILLAEETKVPGENHRPVVSHWQTLFHNVVSSTPQITEVFKMR